MSMYISTGGSGSGTTAMSANSTNNLAVFTTPNVANTMFLVSFTWGLDANDTNFIGVSCLTPGAYVYGASNSVASAAATGGGPNIIKVGPNTAVTVSFSSSGPGAGSIGYAYNYVGIVMDTL